MRTTFILLCGLLFIVAFSSSPTAPSANEPSQFNRNDPCTIPDQHAKIAGQEVLCQKDSQGNYAWMPADQTNNGNQNQSQPTMIGGACNLANALKMVGGGLGICRAGSWRYALPMMSHQGHTRPAQTGIPPLTKYLVNPRVLVHPHKFT